MTQDEWIEILRQGPLLDQEQGAEIADMLAALPEPTGDVGELVERLRDASDVPTEFCNTYHVHQYRLGLLAADALTAQAAKLAELWAERTQILQDVGADQFELIKRAEAAEARLAECERERGEISEELDEHSEALFAEVRRYEAATARAERLEAAFKRARKAFDKYEEFIVSGSGEEIEGAYNDLSSIIDAALSGDAEPAPAPKQGGDNAE